MAGQYFFKVDDKFSEAILDEFNSKLDLEGGTLTGSLVINNNDKANDPISLDIKGTQSDGGTGNFVFRAYEDNGKDLVVYRGPISDDKEITTKEYVDTEIEGIKRFVHPGRRFQYVDTAIQVAEGKAYLQSTTGQHILDMHITDLDGNTVNAPSSTYKTNAIKNQMVFIYDKNMRLYKAFTIDEVSYWGSDQWTWKLQQDFVDIIAAPIKDEEMFIACPFW